MSENRRGTFRSPRAEPRDATLISGREHMPVQILDESAGGFCVCAEDVDELPTDAEVELVSDDGERRPVIVKHCERRGMYLRIGLQRTEMAPVGASLLQRAFAPQGERSANPLTIALVAAVGLLIGGLIYSEPLRERAAKLPGFSRLLNIR